MPTYGGIRLKNADIRRHMQTWTPMWWNDTFTRTIKDTN